MKTVVVTLFVALGVATTGDVGAAPAEPPRAPATPRAAATAALAAPPGAQFFPALAAAPGPAATTVPERPPEPYQFQSGVLCPLCKLTPQFPEGRSGLHWHGHWNSVGVREYVTVGALASAALGVQLFVPAPSSARWESPILFDAAVRDALRIGSTSGRKTAAIISDSLFIWELLHTSLLDPLLVAWWRREAPLVAWQMLVIDAQAYSLTMLLNTVAKRAVARARPWVATEGCESDPTSGRCQSDSRYVAFYSGHSAITATSAGLMCAHHTQLSLYQNDLLDTGMCGLAIAGTAITGAMRIASDNHWATDVIFGHLLGYASGYLVPTLLYYKEFRTAPHEHDAGPTYALLPLVSGEALGLSVFGAF